MEEPNEQEAESSQQILEQAQKLRDEAVANIHLLAEEVINEGVYNLPLSFDTPREEYRSPETCANLYCQIPVVEERKYCHFHQWEIENDERFNAERKGGEQSS